jgi:single-strand DNA-binding protein
MSGSLNRVTLIGNVGRDPEIRTTQSGTRVASVSIATSETWKDKGTGDRREATQWHKCVIWNEGLIGVIEQYVKKGSKIFIEGQMQTRKWTDQQGVEKYTTEVVLQNFNGKLVLLSGGGNSRDEDDDQSAGQGGGAQQSSGGYGYGAGGGGRGGGDLNDDISDIPF